MISLTLPWPPSTNTLWRNVVIGGRSRTMLSGKARSFYEACGAAVLSQRANQHLKGRIEAWVVLSPPDRRRRDIDNCKAVLDALHKCGVIEDDSQIDKLHLIRSEPVRGGSVKVSLQEVA